MRHAWIASFMLSGACALAQVPSASTAPMATMQQLMLDLIHPASNEILLAISRGLPKDDQEWAAVRRSALVLEESGNLLTIGVRARDQGNWIKDARALSDVGAAAYQAAQARDLTALSHLADSLDASCTTCHKQYRPNVFPREGAAK
jgi:cytochrome c556